jgi:fatty-acyl-CoA synthase
MELHLADAFAAAARRAPDHPCVVAGSRRMSFAQIQREVQALAASLAGLGVRPGDRIATVLPNRSESVTTLLAAAGLGATLVPLNPGLAFDELEYQLRHAAAAAVVSADVLEGRDYLEWFDDLLGDLPELRILAVTGNTDAWYDDRVFPWADLVAQGAHHEAPPAPREAGAPLAIIYTSGTTGKPKGVVLSHRAIVGSARATFERLALVAGDRSLLAVPGFTIFGLTVTVGALDAGSTLVMQERFEAASAVELLARERCTLCHGVPTIFALLLREAGFTRETLPDLRSGLVAGSPVASSLVNRIRAVCDVEIAYGLTETGPTVAMTVPSDEPANRAETVGRPLPEVEVRIVDLGTGTAHGVEAVGELAVRSATLMSGYHRMPAETRRSFDADGYFLTGDLAMLDSEGYLRIVARRKELIIRGGMNLHPREVEDVLRAHPAVEDVCVVGMPHDVLGEQICACIVPMEGAAVRSEDVMSFARERLAGHKVPDLVRFFDSLPVTATGKVRRRELAQAVALEHSTA